jgi:hypothetical protein
MTTEEYNTLPEAQRKAMVDLQERSGIPWGDFLEQALPPTPLCDYVAIPNFHGMFVGIENDGYTHS